MLYICATPIGNIEDITLRVLRILKEVDHVIAEDTRHTRKLLSHYQIQTSLISMHQHNEAERTEQVIELIKQGKTLALVSDAGMPGISDPGGRLVQRMIEENLPFTVLPGASALTTAVVHCGLNTSKFLFVGFLPRRNSLQRKELEGLKNLEATLVFYESPHRLSVTLNNIYQVLGDRYCAVMRELTKKFEEVRRGLLTEHLQYFAATEPRGEFVIAVEGYKESNKPAEKEVDIREAVKNLIKEGVTKKDAIKMVARERKLSKNEVYQEVLDL